MTSMLQCPATQEECYKLIQEIRSGSIDAWHRLVENYSGLVVHVLRAHLRDEDDVQTAYVDTLEKLYNGLLDEYQESSSLASWLCAIAAHTAIDLHRKNCGRHIPPRNIQEMGEKEQLVYKVFYLDGLSLSLARDRLAEAGYDISIDELVAMAHHISLQLSCGTQRRLAYERSARQLGQGSARLLEYLDYVDQGWQDGNIESDPQWRVLRSESRNRLKKLHEGLAKLDATERDTIEQFYYQERSAPEIAHNLALKTPRRVYTVVNRALRKLRKGMLFNSPSGS